MSTKLSGINTTLLIFIALLSFGLRIWGIQFGLPFAYHPDEQQYILPALGVVSGEFEPLAYYNPTLYPYFIGVVYALTYAGLRVFDAFPDFFDLNNGWSQSMQPWTMGIIYLARFTTAAVGLLTTLVVYQLGRRAYSRPTGVAAAVIFGFSFLPVREAHFAVSDAPVALGVAVTLYLCLRIVERGQWADYLVVGIALGLSAATKYSAALLVLPVGVAHLLSRRYWRWSQRMWQGWLLLITGVVAVISYAVASPYTFLHWDEFWADFSENLESARVGFQGLNLDPAGGAIFYLKALIWGFGWPLFLLFLGSIAFALWRRRRADLLLVVFPVFGFWYMQRQEMYFARWLMPFLPPLAVLAGEVAHAGVTWGLSLMRTKQARVTLPSLLIEWAAPIGLAALLTAPATYTALKANYLWSQPDTRTEALNWITENIPPGSSVATEVLSPPWGPPLAMPGLDSGPYHFAPVPNGGVAEVALEQYRNWGVQYVVASSFHYKRQLLDKERQAKLEANLQKFDEQAELVAEFQPYRPEYSGFFYHDQVFGPANDTLSRNRAGPVIKIYRLP